MAEKGVDRPSVGIAVFVMRGGKFLFMQRKGAHGAGTWATPGGHLENGESFAECASREVSEETGMEIRNIHTAGVTNDIFESEDKHYVTVWLTAEWAANEPEIREPQKCTGIKWVDFDSLPRPLFATYEHLFESDFYDTIKHLLAETRQGS